MGIQVLDGRPSQGYHIALRAVGGAEPIMPEKIQVLDGSPSQGYHFAPRAVGGAGPIMLGNRSREKHAGVRGPNPGGVNKCSAELK
eukprot:7594419-Heterocapsa_arctica.AAC.1